MKAYALTSPKPPAMLVELPSPDEVLGFVSSAPPLHDGKIVLTVG